MQPQHVYSNVCRHINDNNIKIVHSKYNSMSLYPTTCWRSVVVLTACKNNCVCAANFHSAIKTFSLVLAVPSSVVTMSVELWTALSHLPDYPTLHWTMLSHFSSIAVRNCTPVGSGICTYQMGDPATHFTPMVQEMVQGVCRKKKK